MSKNPRVGRDGKKIPLKITMHRHQKTKLEPEQNAKRAEKNARLEKRCFGCSTVKPMDQFRIRVRDTFTKNIKQESRSLCNPCDAKRKRNQDHRDNEFDKEEFYSPYENAYALGHSFDENLNCAGSGCNVTFDSLQTDPVKCTGKLPSRGKARSCKRMMTKAVNRYRRY